MSFEDDYTELKEFFSSRIEKILNTKLERLSKIDEVFEEVSQLRAENKELKEQNGKLETQLNSLNTSLQEFCQQARAELRELSESQGNLENLLKQDLRKESDSSNPQKTQDAKNRPKSQPILVPVKGSKPGASSFRLSQTDMDNPDRVLTPPVPIPLNNSSKEKTI